jgi:hypothetical protein
MSTGARLPRTPPPSELAYVPNGGPSRANAFHARRYEYTIGTAFAPDHVFTVRVYGDIRSQHDQAPG